MSLAVETATTQTKPAYAGFKNLDFSLVRDGGLRFYSRDFQSLGLKLTAMERIAPFLTTLPNSNLIYLVMRCCAAADGYLPTSIKACRSRIRSSLLKSNIRVVTSPMSVSG